MGAFCSADHLFGCEAGTGMQHVKELRGLMALDGGLCRVPTLRAWAEPDQCTDWYMKAGPAEAVAVASLESMEFLYFFQMCWRNKPAWQIDD